MKNNDIFLNQLEKNAGIWSVAKGVGGAIAKPFKSAWKATPNQVKNIGKGGFAALAAGGAVDHYKEGQKIAPVNKEASFDGALQKQAFIGIAIKGLGKAINTVGSSSIVKGLTSGKALVGAMGAEMATGMYKAKKDQDFKISQELSKQQKLVTNIKPMPIPKQPQQQSFPITKPVSLPKVTQQMPTQDTYKSASILTMPLKRYTRETYYDAQKAMDSATEKILRKIKKSQAFENELAKQAGILSAAATIGKSILAKKTTSNLARATLSKAAPIANKGMGTATKTISEASKAVAGYKNGPVRTPPSGFMGKLKESWKNLGSERTSNFLGNAMATAFAADTAISLNNARKNIQTAAPSVPQRPLNTDMYNNGSHPGSYQNTYTM